MGRRDACHASVTHPPMPKFRDFIDGPWRAVPVLGVTQILAWGSLFYPPVLMMPLIAQDRGWSLAFAMAGFSVALLGALGLVLLVHAAHPALYIAVWVLLGIAIAASLYDPAFATLGRIFGAA